MDIIRGYRFPKMAILHGSWILEPPRGYFFLWGETWRTKTTGDSAPRTAEGNRTAVGGSLVHPFAMTPEELVTLATGRKLVLPSPIRSERQRVAWPSRGGGKRGRKGQESKGKESSVFPVLSGGGDEIADIGSLPLYWWEVEGVRLEAKTTVNFLQGLPLSARHASYLGDSLRFWSQVYRWSLDLIARGKFLPGLFEDGEDVLGCWSPLLDSSIDRDRLQKFTQLMPSVCRTYQSPMGSLEHPNVKGDWPESQDLISSFLKSAIDMQLRSWLEINLTPSRGTLVYPWLHSLSQVTPLIKGSQGETIERLQTALNTWQLPIKDYLVPWSEQKEENERFRICFILEHPTEVELSQGEVQDWWLNYALRSVENPDLMITAKTIWENPYELMILEDGQILDYPQETLLKGLGLAGKIYGPIQTSLQNSQPVQCLLNPIEVYEFIRASAWQLQDSGFTIIWPPGLATGAEEKRLGVKIKAEVKPKKGDRLDLKSLLSFKLELAIGDRTITQKEFERLLEQKSPLVQVGGEWIALQPADVRAARSLWSSESEKIALTVEDAIRLTTGDTKVLAKLNVVQFEASGVLEELITNITENKNIESIPQPKDFKGELRPYQIRGVSWLAFLERWSLGACLADDMGLGKTPQLLAFLLHLQEKKALNQPCLVVCPTSVLGNWEREVKKFAPSLGTMVHHGEKRKKGKTFLKQAKSKQLVLTSYSLVYRDLETLQAIEWEGVVLDEAQNIKNFQSKQAQATRELKAGFRIALTGTPVENRLTELWSILEFLNPGFLGNKQFFQKRFAVPIEKYGDRNSLFALRSLVQPFILRRLKTDKDIIQDLPEKQEMTVFCGLSLEQATLYQQLVEKSLEQIDESKGIQRKGLILSLLVKLKQVCNHPALLLKEKGMERGERSGKLLRLEEMLEEVVAEGDHALIFTQFAEWGKLLKPYLERKLSTEILFLYGATPREDREEIVDRFQNDPEGPQILILSLKAGGTGLNLTRANHVFHVDRWWNPAVENQATDRAFRIGQKLNVQVHKFVCTGTLEEKINDLLESKKNLAEQTVDAGEQWLTELDTDHLRNLLLLDRSAVLDED